MSEEIEVANERHPIRFMFKLVVFLGLLYAAGKFLNDKKNEYADLTESEARRKFVDTVAPRVGDETAEEIADQVIPKLKDRGFVKPDPMDTAGAEPTDDGEVKQASDGLGEKVETDSDQVKDAVDSVVKE